MDRDGDRRYFADEIRSGLVWNSHVRVVSSSLRHGHPQLYPPFYTVLIEYYPPCLPLRTYFSVLINDRSSNASPSGDIGLIGLAVMVRIDDVLIILVLKLRPGSKSDTQHE
jgi:hypothetical protein